MTTLVKIEGYLIPDARMLVTHAQWFTIWTQSAKWDPLLAVIRGAQRLLTWKRRLCVGSFEGIVRVRLIGTTGASCCEVAAPGHERSGDSRSLDRPLFQHGDLVTKVNEQNPTARIVERIVRSNSITGGVELESLYLAPSFCTRVEIYSLDGYRLANDEDHRLAKLYAEGFEEPAGDQPAPTSGGTKATTRGARSQAGKRSNSQTSQPAMRDTQKGSARTQSSQDLPSHSASSSPAEASSTSTTAASESRKPKPKKRRAPRDHVS